VTTQNCKSRTESDGSHTCNRCGFQWGKNDKNPPKCLDKWQYNAMRIELIRKDLGIV